MAEVAREPFAGTDDVLPAVPASASALIFDDRGWLLILRPTYKSGWTIPGGVMENDGETPWEACRREVREECGLEVTRARLACVDFRPKRPGRAGGIRFLFHCGQLNNKALRAITLQPAEIAEHRLVAVADALPLLRKPIRRRVGAAVRADGRARRRGAVYLEDGRPVSKDLYGVVGPMPPIEGQQSTQCGPYRSSDSRERRDNRREPRQVFRPGEARGRDKDRADAALGQQPVSADVIGGYACVMAAGERRGADPAAQ